MLSEDAISCEARDLLAFVLDELAARAAPALRHAADGQAVRWPVGRATVTDGRTPAAQRSSLKGPAAWPLAAAEASGFEGGAYR